MKELILLSIIVILICATGPAIAWATMKEVKTEPPQRCGMKCIQETFVFDTEQEAKANKYGVKPYKIGDTWFIDVQMTEEEANLL